MTTIYLMDDPDYGEKTYFSSRKEGSARAEELFYILGADNKKDYMDYMDYIMVLDENTARFRTKFFRKCKKFDLSYERKTGNEKSSDDEILVNFINQPFEIETVLTADAFHALKKRIGRSPALMKAVREKAF